MGRTLYDKLERFYRSIRDNYPLRDRVYPRHECHLFRAVRHGKVDQAHDIGTLINACRRDGTLLLHDEFQLKGTILDCALQRPTPVRVPLCPPSLDISQLLASNWEQALARAPSIPDLQIVAKTPTMNDHELVENWLPFTQAWVHAPSPMECAIILTGYAREPRREYHVISMAGSAIAVSAESRSDLLWRVRNHA